jgi:hypothetical protein
LFNSLPQPPQLVGPKPISAAIAGDGGDDPQRFKGDRRQEPDFRSDRRFRVIKQRVDARLERRARTCLAPFWEERRPANLSNMASPISAAGRA